MRPTARPLFVGLLVAIFLMTGSVWGFAGDEPIKPDPTDPTLVTRGKVVYAEQCASCHGTNLEGQPNWRHRLPNGRMPAPPHDATGHTIRTSNCST
jgi:hypothetical protein